MLTADETDNMTPLSQVNSYECETLRRRCETHIVPRLKIVLGQLHLPKSGRKQNLVDRITDHAMLSRENYNLVLTHVEAMEEPSAEFLWNLQAPSRQPASGANGVAPNASGKRPAASSSGVLSEGPLNDCPPNSWQNDKLFPFKAAIKGAPSPAQGASSSGAGVVGVGVPLHAKAEIREAPTGKRVISCICGSNYDNGSQLLRCEGCGIYEHALCVAPSFRLCLPRGYICLRCRANIANPFVCTSQMPMPPMKLAPLSGTTSAARCLLNRSFIVTADVLSKIRSKQIEVHVECFRLHHDIAHKAPGTTTPVDISPCCSAETLRYEFPCNAEVRVNCRQHSVVARDQVQYLQSYSTYGENREALNRIKNNISFCAAKGGSGASVNISASMLLGMNSVSISGWDTRSFGVLVRLVTIRKNRDVLNDLVPLPHGQRVRELAIEYAKLNREWKELQDGKNAKKKKARVSGKDEDVVFSRENVISLLCPLTGMKIRWPGRLRGCDHMAAFDLENLIEIGRESGHFECPHCSRRGSLADIEIDPYIRNILDLFSLHPSTREEECVCIDDEWMWKTQSMTTWFPADISRQEFLCHMSASNSGGGGGTSGCIPNAVQDRAKEASGSDCVILVEDGSPDIKMNARACDFREKRAAPMVNNDVIDLVDSSDEEEGECKPQGVVEDADLVKFFIDEFAGATMPSTNVIPSDGNGNEPLGRWTAAPRRPGKSLICPNHQV